MSVSGALDAERLQRLEAAARDVFDRQIREAHAIRRARHRAVGGRAGRAEAAAERVHAHDEVAVGVDEAAGADHAFPPALARVFGRRLRVRRRRKPREQQDGVAARRVQRAPRFVGDARAMQDAAAPHRERIGERREAAGIHLLGHFRLPRRCLRQCLRPGTCSASTTDLGSSGGARRGMSDLFDIGPDGHEPRDPMRSASNARQHPKRFYKAADHERRADGLYAIRLDGEPVRTPAKAALAVAGRRARRRDRRRMGGAGGLHRSRHHAGDAARQYRHRRRRPSNAAAVRAEILNYAGSDLVCYRAGDPGVWSPCQAAARDPLVDWMGERSGARFLLAEGVITRSRSLPRRSPPIDAALGAPDPLELAALKHHQHADRLCHPDAGAAARRDDAGRGLGGGACRRGFRDQPLGRGFGGDRPAVRHAGASSTRRRWCSA